MTPERQAIQLLTEIKGALENRQESLKIEGEELGTWELMILIKSTEILKDE